MKQQMTTLAGILLAGSLATATAQTAAPAAPAPAPARAATPVTAETFVRAETDMYFGVIVKKDGFGKFEFNRDVADVERQTIIRMNRDTLYGGAVFDLDAGPVTITLPDAGKRFLSMQVIDQDQYTHDVFYKPGSYTFSRDKIGTRYVAMALRVLVDPSNPADLQQAHALQDAVRVSQKRPGAFEVPQWDPVSQKRVRDALLTLAETIPDTNRTFGRRGEVDPVRRLIGAASAWGGNPEKDATYLNITPSQNDGRQVYRLTVKDVPVDGFWSISVYNAKGYFEPNLRNAYTISSFTSKKRPDGAVDVQFGGCDRAAAPNCVPITPGWNYMVRLYRPHPEILQGKWTFPAATPVN